MYNFNYQNKKVDNDIQTLELMDRYYETFIPEKYGKKIKKICRVSYEEYPRLQKAGIDVAIQFEDNSILKIDEKIRYTHRNDILLETWSNYENKIAGWTVDETKETDIIFYVNNFIHVLDFKRLLKLYKENEYVWRQEYGQISTYNENYGIFYTTIGTPIPIEQLGDIHYSDFIKYRNL